MFSKEEIFSLFCLLQKYVNKFIGETSSRWISPTMLLVSPLSAIIENLQKYSSRFRSRISLVSILIRVNLHQTCWDSSPISWRRYVLWIRPLDSSSIKLWYDRSIYPLKPSTICTICAFTHIVIPTNINNVTEFDRCRRRDRISFVTRV